MCSEYSSDEIFRLGNLKFQADISVFAHYIYVYVWLEPVAKQKCY
jgi:hypothetical protein